MKPDAPSPFLPVRREPLSELVVRQLRLAITTGELKPDMALSEPTLAAQLGVSRSPIREALIQLEREGLIRFDHRGRTRVCSMNAEDFTEISSMRVALESLGASWAARHWTAENTRAVEENIALQEKAPTLAELSRLDVEMHDYVLRAARHQRLLASWLMIRPQFEMWLAHIHRLQEKLSFRPRQVTVESHLRLLAMLAGGSPAKAERAMRAHVESWAEWLPRTLPDPAVRTASAGDKSLALRIEKLRLAS